MKLFILSIFLAIISLLFAIIITRIILYITLLGLDNLQKTFKGSKSTNTSKKEEDELLRDKKREKRKEKELQNAQESNELIDDVPEKPRIVGIAKPVGYWTSLIIGQRLREMFMEKDIENTWVNKIGGSRRKGKEIERER
jgi:hypothetical protein